MRDPLDLIYRAFKIVHFKIVEMTLQPVATKLLVIVQQMVSPTQERGMIPQFAEVEPGLCALSIERGITDTQTATIRRPPCQKEFHILSAAPAWHFNRRKMADSSTDFYPFIQILELYCRP